MLHIRIAPAFKHKKRDEMVGKLVDYRYFSD